jgi:hypothetical protein
MRRSLLFILGVLTLFGVQLAFADTTYYVIANTARARACPRTSCDVVARFGYGTELTVEDTVRGERVSGSNRWLEVHYQGELVYVHSSLASTQRGGGSSGNNGGSSSAGGSTSGGSSGSVSQPTAAPQTNSYACNCSRTCGQMTCEEAYFQLNQCGCGRRDGDNDGVPCEEICPGG